MNKEAQRVNAHVTLKDIASRCGVTAATVSRILSGKGVHSRALTDRICRVAKEMGYVAERQDAARRLSMSQYGRMPRNNVVAAVLPDHFYDMPYYLLVLEGLLEESTPRGIGLLTLRNDCCSHGATPSVFQRGGIDGLIGFPDFETIITAIRSEPALTNCPVISLIDPEPDSALVTFDYRAGMRGAARQLIAQGHREIGYVCKPRGKPSPGDRSDEQRAGMREAFEDAGMPWRGRVRPLPLSLPLWNLAFNPMWLGDPAQAALAERPQDEKLLQRLKSQPGVTAIIAPNDMAARMVCRLLTNAGYGVPDDYSVVGCDNICEIETRPGEPTLTTLDLPLRELGGTAMQRMLDTNHPVQAGEVVRLPVRLVKGESTGPAPNKGV